MDFKYRRNNLAGPYRDTADYEVDPVKIAMLLRQSQQPVAPQETPLYEKALQGYGGMVDSAIKGTTNLVDSIKNYFSSKPTVPGGGTGSPVKRDAISELIGQHLEDRKKKEVEKATGEKF